MSICLHSVVSPADIFPVETPRFTRHSIASGVWVTCFHTQQGERLCALHSTNPRDFLNPALCPGAVFLSGVKRKTE